jgi:hypothetical protein
MADHWNIENFMHASLMNVGALFLDANDKIY